MISLVGGLEHLDYFSIYIYIYIYIGNFIIPTDFHSIIFHRAWSTTNQIEPMELSLGESTNLISGAGFSGTMVMMTLLGTGDLEIV